MGSVDKVLSELHAGGFTALAGEVPGLRPQKNEPTPGVLDLQRRYARVPSSPLTAAFTDQVVVSTALPPPAGPVHMAVTLDIVQAPSAFALPVMQKRPWDPPFQLRMTWRSSLPLQFSTTVAAFVVDEAALPSMLTWQPPTTTDVGKTLLDYQQERMVVLTPVVPGDGSPSSSAGGGPLPGSQDCLLPPGAQEHSAEAVFTFNKLSFGAPSQMRPRWLVFAASLLGGGCVYSHYLVPTVVMSRMAEQFEKAKVVLWGSQQPAACDSSVMKMDYRQLRKYIKRELTAVGISREPSEEDYRYLATRAGFVTSATGVRAASASLQELAAFKEWFDGHVILLKHILAHYERSDPQVVCGFGVTREQADALLAPHPAGTFLLRFGSQGGQLVLSVRSAGGGGARPGSTTHYSIPTAALQRNGLEAVLERNGTAEQLLDVATGHRHLRTAVLDRSYLQAVDMAEVRKRIRRPESRVSDESQASPSPSGPPPGLAACQQQPADLGGQLDLLPSLLAMPQLHGGASGALLGAGSLLTRAYEPLVPRQYSGREASVTSMPSMHPQQHQQLQELGQLAGGLLPPLGAGACGAPAAPSPLVMGARAGEGAGTCAQALGTALPAGQVPPAAAAHNPFSAASLLLRAGPAAASVAHPTSDGAWRVLANRMEAALPPALVTQRPPVQLGPAAELAAEQHQAHALLNRTSLAWGGPGLAPLLGTLQDAPQWQPLGLPPAAGLAAAAAGTLSHHSTPGASAASRGGTDDTPSIGPAPGPTACQQGQHEGSEGTASGSAACSEGAARLVGHAPFPEHRGSADALGSACSLPASVHMHHQLAGCPSNGRLQLQQQYGVQAGGAAASGEPLPAWLHGLQLGGRGAAAVDVSAVRHLGAKLVKASGPGAAQQDELLLDLLA
ncbi:hypothetical protein ABPG77_003257 [Micractinium sp. CCAP 211/92]